MERWSRATAIVSNRVAIRELNGVNGYCLAPLPIDSVIESGAVSVTAGHDIKVRRIRHNKP